MVSRIIPVSIFLILIVATISLSSSVVITSPNSFTEPANFPDIPAELDPEKILNDVNSSSYDAIYGGHLYLTNTGSIAGTAKGFGTLGITIKAYLELYEFTGNASYLEFAEKLFQSTENFIINGVYYDSLDQDWTNPGTRIPFNGLFGNIGAYANLYRLTGNTTYLNAAVSLYSFLETNFYDNIDGGYAFKIFANTLSEDTGVRRNTDQVSSYAGELWQLYLATSNETYADRGVEIQRELIDDAWNDVNGYFYRKLTSLNTPDVNFDELIVNGQSHNAISLLIYSQYKGNQDFTQYAKSIMDVVFNIAIINNQTIQEALPSGSITDSTISILNQLIVFETLLEFVQNRIELSAEQKNFIFDFFDNLIFFYQSPMGGFGVADTNSNISMGINSVAIITLIGLLNLVNSIPNVPSAFLGNRSSPTSIELEWSSANREIYDIQSFKIYRTTNLNFGFIEIGQTTLNNYLDNGLNSSEIYYYKISSINQVGESVLTPVLTVQTQSLTVTETITSTVTDTQTESYTETMTDTTTVGSTETETVHSTETETVNQTIIERTTISSASTLPVSWVILPFMLISIPVVRKIGKRTSH